MARRVNMPAADDLFRPTAAGTEAPAEGKPRVRAVKAVAADSGADTDPDGATARAAKRASGRIRHDEKMTVYVTSEELVDIETTRLELRAAHGLAVDRGRLVREAIDLVLEDFHAQGADSMLVRRLHEA